MLLYAPVRWGVRRLKIPAQRPMPPATNGAKPVRALLALLIGWTVLREAEVGPLRSLMHGPAFGKLACWIVVVGASLLTLWRGRSIRGREGLAWGLIGTGSRCGPAARVAA
jgi:hypothetical protein